MSMFWTEEELETRSRETMTELEQDVTFWEHVNKTETCWLWTGALTSNGYGCLYRQGKTQTASRYSWTKTFGNIPEGLFVLHRCDVRRCVNPLHLFLGTHQDNMRDRNAKNRQASGKKNGRVTMPQNTARGEFAGKTKLTALQVRELRKLHSEGVTIADLARKYNISWNATNAIVKETVWKHLL